MKNTFVCLFLLLASVTAHCQDTTGTAVPAQPSLSAADSLLADLTSDATGPTDLLPKKMTLGQRVLWSRKGLMRQVGISPLTPESREKELKVRRTMLVTHQVLGFVTLAGMIAQGIVGSQLYKAQGADYVRLHDAHTRLATGINIAYGTTALLAFTSPPRLPTSSHRRGFSSIRLHKALAFVHLTGMVATNILARQIERNPDLKPYHRAAAFTTFGAFGASIIAIKF